MATGFFSIQAVRNLANRSSERVKQLFIELDRRLKSTDSKIEHQIPGIRGQPEQSITRERFIKSPAGHEPLTSQKTKQTI